MSAPQSVVWLHMKRDSANGVAICTHCHNKKTFVWSSGKSTTTMLRHLISKHPHLLQPMKHETTCAAVDIKPVLQNTLSIARPLSIQATNLADQAILKLVIFQMLPLSLVDAPEFDLLFAALGAKYHTPCRQTLTNRIINLYHVQQERMSQKLAREAISVAVTCDGWTSQQVVGYVAVTGHYLTEHFQPTRYCVSVVQTSSHTGDNIANAVLNKVKEATPVTVLSATTDNASNMDVAVRIANIPHHVHCAGHTMALTIGGSLTKFLSELLVKLHTITTHFSHSVQAREEFAVIQKQLYERDGTVWQPLQFISDVKTRWNSTFLMIQRFLKLEVAVRLVTVAREKLTPLMDEDWSVMKLLEQMLLPFFEFTELVSGDTYATLSLLYPAVRAVLHHFRQLKPKITALNNKALCDCFDHIRSQFAHRWSDVPDVAFVATMLDPRFKHMPYFEAQQVTQARQILDDLFVAEEKLVREGKKATEDSSSVNEPLPKKQKSALASYICSSAAVVQQDQRHLLSDELRMYLLAKPIDADEDPLKWWLQHQTQFPILARLARKYLLIPATSVSSERLFSDAGNIITQKRTRLDPAVAVALIWLYENRNFLDFC